MRVRGGAQLDAAVKRLRERQVLVAGHAVAHEDDMLALRHAVRDAQRVEVARLFAVGFRQRGRRGSEGGEAGERSQHFDSKQKRNVLWRQLAPSAQVNISKDKKKNA